MFGLFGWIEGGPHKRELVEFYHKFELRRALSKETSWMRPYIIFEVNLMPITPSSVAHKFNNFILKEKN